MNNRASGAPFAVGELERPLVALTGNPNTGKTCVFNLLSGARRKVANYPGVTVTSATGSIRGGSMPVDVIDLPGTYSLAARSPDEMLVVDVLLGSCQQTEKPRAVVSVIDACHLERNLFLTTQLLELGMPVVVALNMVDLAKGKGIEVDAEKLSERLGAPVIPIVARTGDGRAALIRAIEQAVTVAAPVPPFRWPDRMGQIVAAFVGDARRINESVAQVPDRVLERALIDVNGQAERQIGALADGAFSELLGDYRSRLEQDGYHVPDAEARLRYAWIGEQLQDVVRRRNDAAVSVSDWVDRWVLHPVTGTVIFVVLTCGMFMAIFSWAAPLMMLIDALFSQLAGTVHGVLGDGVLASFLADGVIAGVGGVLVFLPQILILIVLIALLEDCGYLARAAFLMDRVFRSAGLSGSSFVPLLSSFACAVPGVMAARTIPDTRSRIITMVVAPLMSCSARIPIYTLMVAAFVPPIVVAGFLPLQGLVFASMYFVGVAVAAVVAVILSRWVGRGQPAAFFLEMPAYKWPRIRDVLLIMYDRGKDFVVAAGTIILAMSVIIWAMTYFPRPAALEQQVRADMAAAGVHDEAAIDSAVAGAYVRQSVMGRLGHAIEPAVKPLGWDWRIGMASLAAFPAREVVISTLGIVYNLGEGVDETTPALRQRLINARLPDGRKVFTLPVALSIMVFFALCCQCQATLAVIKRETNSWRWPIFTFVYMTTLAYVGAFVVYQVGSRIAGT